MMTYKQVKRGGIYSYDWGGLRGKRPAIVIQNDELATHQYVKYTTIAYITSSDKRKELPNVISARASETGLKLDSYIDLSIVASVEKDELKKQVGLLSENRLNDLNNAIRYSFGLED